MHAPPDHPPETAALPPPALAQFDALVLQGGGARCFFTLGFLDVAGPALSGVRQVATVSASAAMGVAHLLGMHREALDLFVRRVQKNPRNFYPERLLRLEQPMPQHAMYRAALEDVLDEARFRRIQGHATRLRILVGMGPGSSRVLVTLLGALSVLRRRTPPLLRAHVIDAGELAQPGQLVDAVLASSAFPPFTPLPLWRAAAPLGSLAPGDGAGAAGCFAARSRALIDGGAVNPVPLCALESASRPLLVLTRPVPKWPLAPGLPLVAPAAPLDIATWQYSDAPALQRVFDAGRRAGERFLRQGPQRTS